MAAGNPEARAADARTMVAPAVTSAAAASSGAKSRALDIVASSARSPRAAIFRALASRGAPLEAPAAGARAHGGAAASSEAPRLRSRDDASQAGERDALDPLARALAAPVAPCVGLAGRPAAEAPASASGAASPSVAELARLLVERIAWSGDARTGTAHVVLGAGRLAGAALTIGVEGRRVRLVVEAPASVDAAAFCERVRERLEARGLEVADVVVR